MRTASILAGATLVLAACGGSSNGDRDAGASGGASAGTSSASHGGGHGQGGGPGTGGSKTDGGPPDGGTTKRSAGCGTTPPHASDFDATATDGDGTTRTYSVLFPTSYDSTRPIALTFAFHGAGGTSSQAEGFEIQTGAGALAASMFVFPQGIPFQNYGVGWDDTCGGRDMVLFDHILSDLEDHYCIDPTRVFAAGFSWGCDQVTALHCCRGDKIRAISAASCTDEFSDPNDATTYDDLPCPTSAQPAIRFTHDSSGGDAGYAKPLFTTTSKLYRAFNQCPGGDALPSNVCTAHTGCTEPFIECPYDQLGHATPQGWGPDTWAFFASFP